MHDAIVVGAGPNGLVAANMLVDAGWSVLVLEAQDEPGGAVRSAEVTAPGYVSDLFSAFYPLGVASPAIRALDLERHGLQWTHAPRVLAHPLRDGRCPVLCRAPEETAASVDAFAPGDGEAWLRLYNRWRVIEPELLGLVFRPFPPVRPALRLGRTLGAGDSLRLARLAALSVRRLGEEEFRGEGARLLLTGCALHTDLSPDQQGGGVFGLLLAMLGQGHGFPVPVGGAGRLTDALVARLRARGGELSCGLAVEEVVVRYGRAVGVVARDGSRFAARHAVLADVPAPALYRDLLQPTHVPAGLRADLHRFAWDQATLKVDWALSAPVPWSAPGPRAAGTVHLGGDSAALSGYAAALTAGRLPGRPYLLLGQLTTADPTRSPEGTESLWGYSHVPRERLTARALDRQVARMERVIEQYAPGFGDLVLARHVLGPADLERCNPSLVGGALGGGTSALTQQLVFRPTPGLGRPETPVDGLYLASASAHPGGGVHGACGANAAKGALLRARPGGHLVASALHRAARRLAR